MITDISRLKQPPKKSQAKKKFSFLNHNLFLVNVKVDLITWPSETNTSLCLYKQEARPEMQKCRVTDNKTS